MIGAPKRIRIAVAGLKGRCPRPLDDGGTPLKYSRDRASRQRYHHLKLAQLNRLLLRYPSFGIKILEELLNNLSMTIDKCWKK